MDKIKLLIVDDHQMVRLGLSSFMNIQPDIEVVGEAADGESGYLKAKNLKPDVILMDLVMDRLDGIGATQKILAEMPEQKILILTMKKSFQLWLLGQNAIFSKLLRLPKLPVLSVKLRAGKMFCRERLRKKSTNKSIENLNCMTIFQKEKWKF